MNQYSKIEIDAMGNGNEETQRYRIRATVTARKLVHTFAVYSDTTINQFQKRKRGEITEKNRVVQRLYSRLAELGIPESEYPVFEE